MSLGNPFYYRNFCIHPAPAELSVSPPQGVVLEAKVVGAVAGLGELKHDAVAVVGVAGDDRQAVVVVHVQFQVFFVDLRDLFHSDHPQ